MTCGSPVFLIDADNTLWDTDAVFASAQTAMLADVARALGVKEPREHALDFVRSYDQAIARLDHRALRYPPAMLARALAAGLQGAAPSGAAQAVVKGALPSIAVLGMDAITRRFTEALGVLPALLPGVESGFEKLAQRGIAPWIVTEGSAERARQRLSDHGLVTRVAEVIEIRKDVAQFRRLRRRFAGSEVIVIGDQPDRDIGPAHEAHCVTLLVPSRFKPIWHSEASWQKADACFKRFDDAIAWALTPERKTGDGTRKVAVQH